MLRNESTTDEPIVYDTFATGISIQDICNTLGKSNEQIIALIDQFAENNKNYFADLAGDRRHLVTGLAHERLIANLVVTYIFKQQNFEIMRYLVNKMNFTSYLIIFSIIIVQSYHRNKASEEVSSIEFITSLVKDKRCDPNLSYNVTSPEYGNEGIQYLIDPLLSKFIRNTPSYLALAIELINDPTFDINMQFYKDGTDGSTASILEFYFLQTDVLYQDRKDSVLLHAILNRDDFVMDNDDIYLKLISDCIERVVRIELSNGADILNPEVNNTILLWARSIKDKIAERIRLDQRNLQDPVTLNKECLSPTSRLFYLASDIPNYVIHPYLRTKPRFGKR